MTARTGRTVFDAIAIEGGLEKSIAELTKQIGRLTQEVRSMELLLGCIASRLAKGGAWEEGYVKIEGWVDFVEQQLWERARSPATPPSPSPGSRCFACGEEGN